MCLRPGQPAHKEEEKKGLGSGAPEGRPGPAALPAAAESNGVLMLKMKITNVLPEQFNIIDNMNTYKLTMIEYIVLLQ